MKHRTEDDPAQPMMNQEQSNRSRAYQAALQIAQHAIAALINWTEDSLPKGCQLSKDAAAERAMTILEWDSDTKVGPLRLLFDFVQISERRESPEPHWRRMQAIADADPEIPYPGDRPPTEEEQAAFKQQIKDEILEVIAENWQNLSLLFLILEKYGSCLSLDQETVALVDLARITGAVAAVLAQSEHPDQVKELSLIAGDLSGIQDFIYTISSDGALKSLRARSFYLELVTEEVVQQLLEQLALPRTSVIYAGGGNLYLLAPESEIEQKIAQVHQKLNQWLRQEFQGKVFLALDHCKCDVEAVRDKRFAAVWNEAIKKLSQQKSAKFRDQLEDLLHPKRSYDLCRVCHRDDTDQLVPLNPNEPGSVQACETCRQMFELGSELFKVHSMVRSHQETIEGALHTIRFRFSNQSKDAIHYHLFAGRKPLVDDPELVLLINNWTIEDYQFRRFRGRVAPLLLGNYFAEGSESGFMRAVEFAEKAKQAGCIPRVGHLRMDVDRLGQIFANGLNQHYSLPRLAGLSRQMSYFFKVYLNSLAAKRSANLPETAQTLMAQSRPNLLFIYAGGDDLFVSGAWNEVVEFAFDVYQSFRTYTGLNPDITLSGGLTLSVEKYPLYQSADDAKELEDAAKSNGRDSFGLFGEVFKWREWLGTAEEQLLSDGDRNYLKDVNKPELLGVLPFVDKLLNQFELGYSQGFIQNLLLVAQLREQKIAEAEQTYPDQKQAITYFLHLPKLAYSLSRLPQRVRDHPQFKPIRQSLMSPHNSPYFRAIATWIAFLTRTA